MESHARTSPARDTEIANARIDLPGNWIITRMHTSESGGSYDGNGNRTIESIAFDEDEYTLLYGAKRA